MRVPRQYAIVFAILVTAGRIATAQEAGSVSADPGGALARYVAKPEPAYGWTLVEKVAAEGVTIYRLELTSQTWQGAPWKHVLHVYEPRHLKFQDHVILFVAGGSRLRPPGIDEQLLAVGLANLAGGRVALLKQVPNQPLLDDRFEDDLITETWLRYLDTGDESWPLLFPMAKSAVKAMDAVGELGKKEGWPKPADKFVVTGASKRGWTTWLASAADSRVVAIAPLVIDTLNFRAQMRDQVETWGGFSEQIEDYSRKGLIETNAADESPREAALRTMMDPWTYRERIGVPKLIVNGTNDRYWLVDATSNYFDGLVGPKYVLEIPNAGHDLKSGRDWAVRAVAALFRRVAAGVSMPRLEWAWGDEPPGRRLTLTSVPPASSASIWSATSATNDFRESLWTSRPMSGRDGRFETALGSAAGESGRAAAFGELKFVDRTIDPPVTFSLTTTVKTFLPEQAAAVPAGAAE